MEKTSEDALAKIISKHDALMRQFNPQGNWTIVIPIENLVLHKRSLTMGLLKFFKFSRFHLEEYSKAEANILKQNVYYTPSQKKELLKSNKKRHLEPMVGKTCAEIHVSGALDQATNEALSIIDESLNFLKLYRYLDDDVKSRYFGIPGMVTSPVLRRILRLKDDRTYYSPASSWIGYLFPYEIDEARLRFMKQNGLAEIAKLIGKSNRSRLEDRIVASICWFGKAFDVAIGRGPTRPIDRPPFEEVVAKGVKSESMLFFDRLVKLMICAETLFIFNDKEPKRANISERAALLLGKTYAVKREIKRFFGKMYDKRSGIVHRGKTELSERELARLTSYLQAAIITLVKNRKRFKISSEDDLREWFERKKLGG